MKSLLVVIAAATVCPAQSPAFEAASVKLSAPGEEVRMRREPGRLTITNFPLRAMVRYAYDIEDIQISGGPPWFNSDRWDIVATGGREISEAERRRMLQALLNERFHMIIRRETKELPVYALSVAKGGSKLTPGTEGNPERVELNVSGAGFHDMMGQSVPLSTLAKVLTMPAGRIVVDRTGIKGNFDYKLEWVPDPANMPSINGARPDGSNLDGASIFTAVEEQLGLKLQSAKGPVEILVIDRAEKAAEN
jgi:uncharacterized protein (TIGR03435 family)